MEIVKTDLLIIGGGINGTGIAADASGRGLSVCLCEKDDLGAHTSSASSKLIHGGLRYLETYEFRLVRESLNERATLLKMAPHIIHPIQFLIPFNTKHPIRSPLLVQLGLFIYRYLGRNHKLDFQQDHTLEKLHVKKPLNYFDCTVDDARLVILNAIRAKEHGALILPRTAFISAQREASHWVAQLEDRIIHAKAIINTAGAWVDTLKIPGPAQGPAPTEPSATKKIATTLSKGSHIVVPKLYEGHHAYLLQHPDGRVVFVIPYEQNYTMIGTTDMPFKGDPNQVEISAEEIDYLCAITNDYLDTTLSAKDLVYSWSGLRVLPNEKNTKLSALSRDYKIDLNTTPDNTLPLVTVFGGKITTHRILAEKVLKLLKPYFTMDKAWTANSPLPGGDIPKGDLEKYIDILQRKYPYLSRDLLNRYVNHYGTRTEMLLQLCHKLSDLGTDLGHGLTTHEVDYLCEHEWATSADDILWRRTKLGLVFSKEERRNLENHLKKT